jgi:hypothetical protein
MAIVQIKLESLTNFFHKIGVVWVASLNISTQPWIAFTKIENTWVNGPAYTYPDADFCLFAQNPQQNDLTYILNNSLDFNTCTSSIKWLLFSYFSQNKSDVFYQYPDSRHIYSVCVNSSNSTFDFQPLLERCNLTGNTGGTTLYADYYQMRFILEFFKDLMEFMAIPFACSLGLLLNVLIIRAVHKNKKRS